MESDWISKLEDWPTPKSVTVVEVLLGFTNFHRSFILKNSKVPVPLMELPTI